MLTIQQKSIVSQVFSLSPGLEMVIRNSIRFVSESNDPYHQMYLDQQLNLLSMRSGIDIMDIKKGIRGFLDQNSTLGAKHKIDLVIKHGCIYVPAAIGSVDLLLHFDTGASDVFLNQETLCQIDKNMILVGEGFLNKKPYLLADGSRVEYPCYIIKEFNFGGRIFTNVSCCVSSERGPMLIGKSILNRFSSYSVDNVNRVLNYMI